MSEPSKRAVEIATKLAQDAMLRQGSSPVTIDEVLKQERNETRRAIAKFLYASDKSTHPSDAADQILKMVEE